LAILQRTQERTRPTARLLSFEDIQFDALAIHYFSYLSLVHCYKHLGTFGHTSDRVLLDWGDAQAKCGELRSRPRDASLLEAAVAFARELEADHLLVHAPPFARCPQASAWCTRTPPTPSCAWECRFSEIEST